MDVETTNSLTPTNGNGNGHQPGALVPGLDARVSHSVANLAPVLVPRAKRYLEAHLELLRSKQDPTRANLATHMGLVRPRDDSPEEKAEALQRARRRLDRWLARHPEVDVWLEQQFERLAPSKFQIANSFGRAAIRGSVPHADWLARVFGWYARDPSAPAAGGGTAVQQTVVVIHE